MSIGDKAGVTIEPPNSMSGWGGGGKGVVGAGTALLLLLQFKLFELKLFTRSPAFSKFDFERQIGIYHWIKIEFSLSSNCPIGCCLQL